MSDDFFLQSLGLILIAAAVCALLARRFGLPTILAYLVAGLVIGPLSGLLAHSEAMDVIAEAGIVLLLFLVGLELSVEKIRAVGRRAAIAGIAQIMITFPIGLAAGLAIGLDPIPAGVLGVGLTLSSTVVVVKMLVEKNATGTVHGQTAIGILLVQDIFVIILLTVLSGLGDGGAESLDAATVAKGAGLALAKMAVVLVGITLAARFLLPLPFDWARRSRETVFIASLAWCFAVVLAAHQLHLAAEIGAFLAGLSLAQLPHAHDLQRRVTPLMNCFVAVFFVTLAAGIELPAETAFWIKAAALSALVVVGKFFIIAAVTRRLGYSPRQAFDTSLMLVQISEFSFIFAAAAAGAGLVGVEMRTLLAVVGLITITASSIASLFAGRLRPLYCGSTLSRLGAGKSAPPEETGGGDELSGHVIVIGMNTLGRELVQRLCERGTTVLAVDTDPRKLTGLPCKSLEGDAATPAVLEEAGLARARLLVSTLHITEANELLAYRARAAGVPCSIHVPDIRRTANLLELGAAHLMTPKADSLRLQKQTLSELGLLKKS